MQIDYTNKEINKMELNLKPGLRGTITKTVTPELTAKAVGSGEVNVFATPMMIALMEQAAYTAVGESLPEGYTTVGTHMDSTHLAATPVGMEVRAEAKLIEVDNKKLVFSVEAYDEKECIGKGVHTRFAVDSVRFHTKAEAK